MEPISPVLPGSPELQEVVYGKDQPEYKPLPAVTVNYSDGSISVVTRWRLSLLERLRLLVSGCFWWEQMTFGNPLQPVLPHLKEPLI